MSSPWSRDGFRLKKNPDPVTGSPENRKKKKLIIEVGQEAGDKECAHLLSQIRSTVSRFFLNYREYVGSWEGRSPIQPPTNAAGC